MEVIAAMEHRRNDPHPQRPVHRPPMAGGAGGAPRVVAGRYALVDVLGRGGMGVVWLATDQLLERQVALKEITYPIALGEDERAVLRERTMREARAAARLHHPCVTAVYDIVEEDGKPWLVMERVRAAHGLDEIVDQAGPLPPLAVARIGLDVLAALEAAHAAGVVHRDVKPANVLVEPDGHARLTDFGIATTTGDPGLTGGALIGSPAYMAPERVSGEEAKPPVDLWSLGATLYTAVEGRRAFERGQSMATLMAVVSEDPPPMVRAGALEPVLRGLLIKDPARRSSAAKARGELQAIIDDRAEGPSAPPPAPDHDRIRVQQPPATGDRQSAAPPSSGDGVRGDALARFGAEDLRALAAASRVVVGSVVGDLRDQAHYLADRRRDRQRPRRGRSSTGPPPRDLPAGRRKRWRFKRRWVVVPLLVVFALALAVMAGIVFVIAHTF